MIVLPFLAINLQCSNKNDDIKLEDELLLATLEGGKVIYSFDKSILLDKVNKEFVQDSLKFDTVELKLQKSIGDKSEQFYCMLFKSNTQNLQMVRYVVYEKNKFYFKNAKNEDEAYLQYYVACMGISECFPRLYVDNQKLSWICRDHPNCAPSTDENFCQTTTSIIR